VKKKHFNEERPGNPDERAHSLFETERLEDYAALAISALLLLIVLALF